MFRETVDLSCDMGENFGFWTISEASDEAFLELVSSANIATGFHAGDPNLMNGVVHAAVVRGVALGAHPGYRDLQGFGRRVIGAAPEELVNDILYQLGALREFACRKGKVRRVEGEDIAVEFESICFHSDTPGALAIGTALRARIREALA